MFGVLDARWDDIESHRQELTETWLLRIITFAAVTRILTRSVCGPATRFAVAPARRRSDII
jgi:hypothetical protein